MTDSRERGRRDAQAELQGELDEMSDRVRGADTGRVQGELEDLLAPLKGSVRKPESAGGERERISQRPDGALEGDRLRSEREAVEARLDRAADSRRVQHEIDRLLETPDRPPVGLEGPEERIQRLEKISERDPIRALAGFDPERARKLEDLEIRADPDAFIRRHEGGLDPEAERQLRKSLRERPADRRD